MDERRRKLKFRAWRRGFNEMDILMGGFADAHLAELDQGQLDEFEALLDVPDHDVYEWIVGRAEPPPDRAGPVLDMLRSFVMVKICSGH